MIRQSVGDLFLCSIPRGPLMMRRRLQLPVLLTALAVAALAAALLPAQTGKAKGTQYAFLVACSGYNKNHLPPLPYTIKELEEFREVLIASGYDADNIKFLHDRTDDPARYLPEKDKILKELTRLLERVGEADSVVVAFSGHGIHFQGDKSGYFCALNARLDDKKTLVPMDEVFEKLKGCAAGRKLLLKNACRNDPAVEASLAARKVNLDNRSADEVPRGIAALYSCKPGQKSYYYREDDQRTKGRQRSLFFHHVIEAWKGQYGGGEGGLTVDELCRLVKAKTAADADKFFDESQTPVDYRKYEGSCEWVLGRVKEVLVGKEMVVDLGGGVKLELVRIPKGKFLMGSPKDEKDRRDDEEQHEVEITHDFYLGKYPVTQEQYQQLMGKNPSYFCAQGDDKDKVKGLETARFPVEGVTWGDAGEFCETLNKRHAKEKGTFRLPTEAEWEYACRGGTTAPYYFGKECNGTQANCNGTEPYGTSEKGPYLKRPSEVGGYARVAPHPWGLCDMHGNVWQWCNDRYDKGYYGKSPNRDPQGPDNGEDRVLRGGSWDGDARDCRAASRDGLAQSYRLSLLGFRVAFRLD
jgi:formylglycine-generating enzyme required for sulfatase activity